MGTSISVLSAAMELNMSRKKQSSTSLTNIDEDKNSSMNWPRTDRERSKLQAFWKFALSLGRLSRCKRKLVGCVIVTPDWAEVVSIGYNGPPTGVNNDACRTTEGSCGCVHAEANALVKLRTTESNLILITTLSPCELCAGLIMNSKRISRVVYHDLYRDVRGIQLLTASGISVTAKEVIHADH